MRLDLFGTWSMTVISNQPGYSQRGLAILFCALAIVGTATGSEQNPVTVEKIIGVWEARETRIKSLDFICSGQEQLSAEMARRFSAGGAEGASEKPHDTSFEVRHRFAVDPTGRVRFEVEGKKWSAKEGRYVPETVEEVIDGRVGKTFYRQGVQEFPNLHIKAKKESGTGRDVRSLPLRLIYRPFDPALGQFTREHLVLAPVKGVVEGRPCLIVKHGDADIWVDPSKNFAPVRYLESRRGTLKRSIEIKYSEDKDFGWVPKSWTNVYLTPKGDILNSVSATVKEYTLNPDLPERTFDIEYPAGTWINDYTSKEYYIFRGEGDKRHVRPGEFDGTNYQELLHSDPPEAKTRNWFRFLLISNVVILFAILMLVLYRRAYRSPTSSTSQSES